MAKPKRVVRTPATDADVVELIQRAKAITEKASKIEKELDIKPDLNIFVYAMIDGFIKSFKYSKYFLSGGGSQLFCSAGVPYIFYLLVSDRVKKELEELKEVTCDSPLSSKFLSVLEEGLSEIGSNYGETIVVVDKLTTAVTLAKTVMNIIGFMNGQIDEKTKAKMKKMLNDAEKILREVEMAIQ